jgi:starch-binding outer membrane protein, SusD/RagB family
MCKRHFNITAAKVFGTLLLGATTLIMASCNDFLDVRPKSEKVEDELFETADGFESAIYGVYGSLQASSALYCKDLYWGLTDCMAQDLDQNSTDDGTRSAERYDYENSYVKTRFANIWTGAYTSIGYANNVLKNLESRTKEELPLYNLYKGEMLAVRAYLHFDLLRLFCSTDQSKQGIPYTTTYTMQENAFRTVGETYELIINDLKEAEQLLSEEKDNIVYPRNNELYFKFQNYRETHCNYYAVLGMLAKVYWMKGDMENAAKYAVMVIDSGKFPLAEPSEIKDLFAGKLSPKETLWGIYSNTYNETANSYLYKYQSYFSYDPYTDDSGTTHLMPYDKVYSQDVTGIDQDYRKNWFKKGTGNVRCLKTVDYYTIEESQNVPSDWTTRISGITMLHVSELYLIAAEALLSTDYSKAVAYFNAETSSRGLPTLRSDVTLTKDMIFNEYHKEMFGEGQVWYNMKRLNKDITSNLDSKVIPASEDVYVIPIPQDELNYRD